MIEIGDRRSIKGATFVVQASHPPYLNAAETAAPQRLSVSHGIFCATDLQSLIRPLGWRANGVHTRGPALAFGAP
jgi:hypothetical protein